MALISVPNTFSAGAVIVASQHNSNFTTIYSDYNGNIDNTNIVAAAGILYSKLTLTGGIVNADINAGSAIVDTKLAQITTASKVSGTAITGLASLPSGAGIIPSANLPAPANTFKFISKTSPSSVTNSGDIAITNTNYYMINISISSFSAADSLSLLFNNDTGTHYQYVYRGFDAGATANNGNSVSTTKIQLGPSAPGTTYTNYIIYIFPQTPTSWGIVKGMMFGSLNATNVPGYADFYGQWQNSAAYTSFRIVSTGGNNITGDINLYQIQQS